MVQPLYFGFEETRLFGVYHQPARAPEHGTAIVLCPSFGQEAMRSHRAYHVLATLLSQRGFPTLRFDWFGTGDSQGDGGTVEQWTDDVGTAVEEALGRSAMERAIVVGLRLGASVAMRAAPSLREIHGLVLWEPVLDGRAYLRELADAQREWLRGSFARERPGQSREALGFALPDPLLVGIEGIDLAKADRVAAARILLCARDAATVGPLRERLAQTGARVDQEIWPDLTPWVKGDDALEQALVPRANLETIAGWIEGAPA